ncbi:MAG: hypothetical protein ACLUGI_05425 [Subdoligranulum sp.]
MDDSSAGGIHGGEYAITSALALARYDARTSGDAPNGQLEVFLDEHFDNAREPFQSGVGAGAGHGYRAAAAESG